MHVTELSAEQMHQLKEGLFYNIEDECDFLTDEQRERVDIALYAEDVPDDIVYEFYGDVDFTEEDFWCMV